MRDVEIMSGYGKFSLNEYQALSFHQGSTGGQLEWVHHRQWGMKEVQESPADRAANLAWQ